MKSSKPRLLHQSPWNSASQGHSLVGNCAETVRLHEVRYEVLYEVNTRSAHIAEPELPLGLGCVCTQTAAPPLTVRCQLWRCIHVGSHRLRLAAIWLRAALWGRGMHLVFLSATQLISVFCRLRNKGPWVPCCGVVLAVRRVVRCMLGLCRMVGFFSGNGFGIMLSGTSSILDLSVAGDPGASKNIVPDAWRACCLQRHTALLGTMLIWIALLTPGYFYKIDWTAARKFAASGPGARSIGTGGCFSFYRRRPAAV